MNGVLDTAQLLFDIEPTNEPMVCLAMRAQAAAGNIPAVMQLFDSLRTVLNEELDAKPSQQTVRLFEALTRKQRILP